MREGTAFGEKKVRTRQQAAFMVSWARRHLPRPLHGRTLREVAGHYQVTEASVRTWARLGIPPCHGGYPRGAMQREIEVRAKARPKKAQKAPKPAKPAPRPLPAPPPPVDPEVRQEELRAAFIAELKERARPHGRLSRVYYAEIRI